MRLVDSMVHECSYICVNELKSGVKSNDRIVTVLFSHTVISLESCANLPETETSPNSNNYK